MAYEPRVLTDAPFRALVEMSWRLLQAGMAPAAVREAIEHAIALHQEQVASVQDVRAHDAVATTTPDA